jgi:phosphonate transport system substrate-binding protein
LIFSILFVVAHVSSAQEEEIIFVISPIVSPFSTLSHYNEFVSYLSKKTGKKIIPKQRRTYAEINSLLKSGEVEFALICTGAYLRGNFDFGLKLLAVPVINGRTSYNSYIIVNKESKIESFSQLRGKVFAFTDPLSLTGRLYTLHLLSTMGLIPEEFFGKTFYTSSHEKSIQSVANGLADGAAVDSLIFDDLKRKQSPFTNSLRIIRISPSYGIPPIVASPIAEKSTKQLMLNTLIKMAEDPAGKEILNGIQIEKFILPDPAIYDTAVQVWEATFLR